MPKTVVAKEPFKFSTRLHLTELTGVKADSLAQFLSGLKVVPGSSIYHHTHRFLQQHQFFSPEPPNDFAYWVARALGEEALGESLASVDTMQYATIRALRERFITVIEEHIKENPQAQQRVVRHEDEFHFLKSVSFIFLTRYEVKTLKEFVDVLKQITIDSVYFHIFEARLRLEKGTNDFSYWIDTSLGDKDLAGKISRLDPYTQTLEDLRRAIIRIIENKINAGT